MDGRGSITAKRAPGRFRCLPCKRYVMGTESGHCPVCAFVPPSAPILPDRVTTFDATTWMLVLIIVAGIATAIIVTN